MIRRSTKSESGPAILVRTDGGTFYSCRFTLTYPASCDLFEKE
jgi:hypothetical protein